MPSWIYLLTETSGSLTPKNIEEHLEHFGKWMIYGDMGTLSEYSKKLFDFVGKPEAVSAKLSANPALKVPEGYRQGKDHVLIVYCDDRNMNAAATLLMGNLDVKEIFWKYDRDTFLEHQDPTDAIDEETNSALKKYRKPKNGSR